MATYLSSTIQNILNNLSPRLIAEGFSLGTQLEAILQALAAGNLGISLDAAVIDALGEQHPQQDIDNHSGLTFAWKAFRFHNGSALVTVAAGNVLLTASNVNYVEVDRAGTVTANISAFTAGRMPLFEVTAGVSSFVATTGVVIRWASCTLIGTAGITGSLLSTAGATKELTFHLGNLVLEASSPVTAAFRLPNIAGTINRITVLGQTTLAANDTNYWTFGVLNKGQAGAGSTVVVDGTVAANSTKATGGTGLTANVARALTLTGTGADLVHAANDVLLMTFTKGGSPGNLVGVSVSIDTAFAG